MLRLIPVIEFEPSAFSQSQRTSPQSADPAEWRCYWKESLADSGITELDPVDDTWLVRVQDVTNLATINTFLRAKLRDVDAIPDHLISLNGGYILQTDDLFSIYPTCCGSLEDIKSWERAVTYRKPEWTEIWIGHPWIYCRAIDGQLEFSQPAETIESITQTLTVDSAALQIEITHAHEIVTLWGQTLKPELEKFVIVDQVDAAIKMLLWGIYEA
jgi:hypothetical protein